MKKLLSLLLSLLLAFSFAACGNQKAPTKQSTVNEVEQIEEKVEENPIAEPVSVGNKITLDFAEITVDEAGVADNIKTSIKNGNVTYNNGPDSSPDKEFVYIRGTIKNTGKSAVDYVELSGMVEVDGYSYEIDDDIIENTGSWTNTLEPLMTYTYTLYAEIPNELATNFSEFAMNFGFEENFESPTYSSDEEYIPPYQYSINITK